LAAPLPPPPRALPFNSHRSRPHMTPLPYSSGRGRHRKHPAPPRPPQHRSQNEECGMKLPVDVTSMRDLDHNHSLGTVVDFIDQPIVADTNTPFIATLHYLAAGRSASRTQREHYVCN